MPRYHVEFGEFWTGSTVDFGEDLPATQSFTGCVRHGGAANRDGYMTDTNNYLCRNNKTVSLNGLWGEELQGHWLYHLQLGEPIFSPEYVEDPQEFINSHNWAKYCKTASGYRLCGEVIEPKVDHGKPHFINENSHVYVFACCPGESL